MLIGILDIDIGLQPKLPQLVEYEAILFFLNS